jgi:hypothetical protein
MGNPAAIPSKVEPAFLDSHAAAVYLGLSPRTLDRWRWAGFGPRWRKHGGKVLYSITDLRAWSDSRVCTSTSDSGPGMKSGAPA